MNKCIRRTWSVCPTCLQRIPACLVQRNDEIFMEKTCLEHGAFSAVVWRGVERYLDWVDGWAEPELAENSQCPHACGLCAEHQQGTCCLLLEVTQRCNLTCRHCFAESSLQNTQDDPPLEQVCAWIQHITDSGRTFLQLSGGEPTVRDDLPEIIRFAKQAGCTYIQLNSNGLRIAEEPDYAAALAEAGLSFVFMQFDGVGDDIYRHLRGRPLFDLKKKAIGICGSHGLGVTLVPTVVPGVNDQAIGDIVRFAVSQSPVVRGVHFQPVSYFGRYPHAPADSERITLPEILRAIEEQAADIVPSDSLTPSISRHPVCEFHGAYIVMPDGLKALGKASDSQQHKKLGSPLKSRQFVGSRWKRPEESACCGSFKSLPMASTSQCCDITTLDGFLQRARSHAFTISSMAFQDAYTLELDRLQKCSLHVYRNGDFVPFCAYYLTKY